MWCGVMVCGCVVWWCLVCVHCHSEQAQGLYVLLEHVPKCPHMTPHTIVLCHIILEPLYLQLIKAHMAVTSCNQLLLID